MKRFICSLLSVIFLFGMVMPCFAVGNIGIEQDDTVELVAGYQYPITAESEDWFDYTVREKVEMLKIPDEKLTTMTDAELIQAIADYPYLIDIYAYGNSVEDGIAVARTYFSALDELLSRDTVADAFATYGIEVANARYMASQNSATEGYSRDLFVSHALMDILKSTNVSVEILDDVVSITSENSGYTFIYTIDGNRVLAFLGEEEHTEEEHRMMDEEILAQFNVTLISPGTCMYNCHSYAWYAPSEFNQYNIPDPVPYMMGESYVRKYLGGMGTPANTTSIGYLDIIFYGNYEDNESWPTWHSAIYYSFSTSGEPLAMQICRSKWGALGVFEHRMCDVPAGYDIYNITAWRLE